MLGQTGLFELASDYQAEAHSQVCSLQLSAQLYWVDYDHHPSLESVWLFIGSLLTKKVSVLLLEHKVKS